MEDCIEKPACSIPAHDGHALCVALLHATREGRVEWKETAGTTYHAAYVTRMDTPACKDVAIKVYIQRRLAGTVAYIYVEFMYLRYVHVVTPDDPLGHNALAHAIEASVMAKKEPTLFAAVFGGLMEKLKGIEPKDKTDTNEGKDEKM